MDEAEVAKQKYINVLVRSLKTSADTSHMYLFECLTLAFHFSLSLVVVQIAVLFFTLWMT